MVRLHLTVLRFDLCEKGCQNSWAPCFPHAEIWKWNLASVPCGRSALLVTIYYYSYKTNNCIIGQLTAQRIRNRFFSFLFENMENLLDWLVDGSPRDIVQTMDLFKLARMHDVRHYQNFD